MYEINAIAKNHYFCKNFLLKKVLQIFLLLLIASQSYAQQKKLLHNQEYDKKWFHLGFTLATNQMNYRIFPDSSLLYTGLADSVYKVEAHGTVGFNFNVISELRLGNYFSLRLLPGLMLGQRNLVYQMRKPGTPRFEPTLYEYTMKIPSIYIDVPLLLKFRGKRINNYRPYLIGGMAVRYDLDAKRAGRENEGYTINPDPLDYFYEFGFGVDFFLVYFKFAAEFKYSFGMRNILQTEPTEYCTAVDAIKNRIFVLSFHFE